MNPNLETASTKAQPFRNDAQYLEHEIAWLKTRTARINAQRQLKEALQQQQHEELGLFTNYGGPGSQDARKNLEDLQRREQSQRQLIDARLEAHRTNEHFQPLGLDALCEEYKLTDEERLIILVLVPTCISHIMAEETMGFTDRFSAWITVKDVVSVLDPKGLGDFLRFRSLFQAQATLYKNRLIESTSPPLSANLSLETTGLSGLAFAKVAAFPLADSKECWEE